MKPTDKVFDLVNKEPCAVCGAPSVSAVGRYKRGILFIKAVCKDHFSAKEAVMPRKRIAQ